MGRKRVLWTLWLAAVVALAVWLGVPLITQQDQSIYLAGAATDGHHQIELACTACHSSPFGGRDVLQNACIDCHGEELKMASDSHPRKKFTDPRNADRVAKLDARYCVTCHVEHQLERTRPMGVTLPEDFCFHCHADIGEQRDTHRDLGFDTCASAGCHNFHDNLALYEDFLLRHADEPWLTEARRVLSRTPSVAVGSALSARTHDAPASVADPEAVHAWSASAHAAAGVNCSDCHGGGDAWRQRPGLESCRECHQPQAESFTRGKHGMRLAQNLPPMPPAAARIAILPKPEHDSLSCNSCHGAHAFDTQTAAVAACQGCHDSTHVRNYDASPHARLTAQALADGDMDGAVTCATCHMPRLQTAAGTVEVNHNQNDNLRPNEKMIRPVCMNCHGLAFAIDALADRELIERNFNGRPSRHVPSIDMALERDAITQELESSYQ